MAELRTLKDLMQAGDIDGTALLCLELGNCLPSRSNDLGELKATCELVLKAGWWKEDSFDREVVEAASIVGTILLPISKLDRYRLLGMEKRPDLLVQLLSNRPREFRDAWVNSAFKHSLRLTRVVRLLLSQGLATRPTGERLTLALMADPWAFDISSTDRPSTSKSVADICRDNPDLLDDEVWKLFEVEGRSDEAHGIWASFRSWVSAFVELADDGTLDRDLVLDASLVALSRGFSGHNSSGFIQLHNELSPTAEERETRLSSYLQLCTSDAGTIVKFALRSLQGLRAERPLDTSQVVSEIGPAFLTPAKGTAVLAIKVLAASVKDDPQFILKAAISLLPALSHAKVDVQLAAAKQYRVWFPEPPPELLDQVRPAIQQCQATTRALLDDWMCPGAGPSKPIESVQYRPSQPRTVSINTIDWLAAGRVVSSPHGDDELFELAAATLERPKNADQVESLVTALAQSDRVLLRKQKRAMTVARRAQTLLDRNPLVSQQFVAHCLIGAFLPADLQLPKLDPWNIRMQGNIHPTVPDMGTLLFTRYTELAHKLSQDEQFTPLAAPTHSNGILDPLVFADRLEQSPAISGSCELHLALLRLAPSKQRLTKASRHMSTQSETPTEAIHWVGGWYDYCCSTENHHTRWFEHVLEKVYQDKTIRFISLRYDEATQVRPPKAEGLAVCCQTWLSTCRDRCAMNLHNSVIPGLPALIAELNTWETGGTNGPAIYQCDISGQLDPFFAEDAPLGDAAHFLLALTLNKPNPDARATAIDLAITASEDNRLDPLLLGQHIGELSSTGVVVPNRYGPVLAEVAAAVSQPFVIVEVLQAVLSTVSPRSLQHLLPMLELLESLLHDLGCGLDAPTLAALAQHTGKNKTSQAARRVAQLAER